MRLRFHSARLPLAAIACGVLFCCGCEHQVTEPVVAEVIPGIASVTAAANPHNVLSAIVTIQVTHANEVLIAYGVDSTLDRRTPKFVPTGNTAQVPVLGLRPSTSYLMRAEAISMSGNNVHSEFFSFRTSARPQDVPVITVHAKNDPSAGYVLMGFTASVDANKQQHYALAIDNDGEVTWYRTFPGAIVDFQKQPNGHYTTYSATSSSDGLFFEMDNFGNLLREFKASAGYDTGPHELRLMDQGYCLFANERRMMDLSDIGGMADAMVRGTAIFCTGINSSSFFWTPFEHFAVSAAAPDIPLDGLNVNPWHGNAIDLDTDGNLLVSFRNSDEVTKINSITGEIIWRLGGKQNQFAFVNDPLDGFSHQHGIRRLDSGNIILFDNGNLHEPPESRAVEYRLNLQARTAELVWEYRDESRLFGAAMGFAQRLANGNTLINYGTAQRLIEVDEAGNKKWEVSIDTPSCLPYRAFRVASLY